MTTISAPSGARQTKTGGTAGGVEAALTPMCRNWMPADVGRLGAGRPMIVFAGGTVGMMTPTHRLESP
jgi:hypothetical protein